MAVPQAPNLSLVEATETEIRVNFTPLSDAESLQYVLEWKVYADEWSDATFQTLTVADNKPQKAEAHSLEPGTTYCVRLMVTQGGQAGPPGAELVVDTEQVGCTPKQKGCACAIQ